MKAAIQAALNELSNEVRELSLASEVDRLDKAPDPLDFYRNYVAPNVPCIFTNAIDHWPCLKLWSNKYLLRKMGDEPVTIDVTPDGRGDAIVSGPGNCPHFVTPLEQRMPFSSFLKELCSEERPPGKEVHYASHQNGSFLTEYGTLAGDAEMEIPWATKAFGYGPEAVNLWIGNERAVTSFHKDHYENLYAVIAGEKHFILHPPADVHRMYVRDYPTASYCRANDGSLYIEPSDPPTTVPWVSVDPEKINESDRFPLYHSDPPGLHCVVKAGELLYLPSMYYHHVRQKPDESGRTIAMNFWYDMRFDVKYAYYNLAEKVTRTLSMDGRRQV